ncbi:flagellar hook assembly protein FlgD [Arthrobacter sp. MMS18-M83]|uniref:flagellar hook assembly protein FlgD n=1 Tax=Arthrobacter sp. MMS18-M83 TaxID=2996261 RepID=UPI00227C323B|nr:flagellar hook capping FlgD N-terminal domain-containing protein [Arthrobacter sp. MMS18-M83]WAH99078.1 flagellar hook capping protein [Arthrobacter sp. MMS18-M83]
MTIQAIAASSGVQPGTAASGTAASGTAVPKPAQTMDSSMFMSLLVTQLKNQDPSAPMDTNQMMGQTIQLSMMEKMTELSTGAKESFSLQMRTAAAQIIGHNISYALADGTKGSGVASSVSFAGGVPTVAVGGVNIPLDSISGITAAASPAPTA